MNLTVGNVGSNSDYSNKMTFCAGYAEVNGKWHNFAKGGTKLTANAVEKQFNVASEKEALTLSSKDVIANVGFHIQTTMNNLKVILTGKEAKQFKVTPIAEHKNFFNKLFEGVYKFSDAKAKKVENISNFF